MLVDVNINLKEADAEHIETGMYVLSHWQFDWYVNQSLESYPSFYFNPSFEEILFEINADGTDARYLSSYGICDYPRQLLEVFPKLVSCDEKYCVSFVKVEKVNQPERHGWRWHKWGQYIGIQNPQHEYLFDEMDIDTVYTFSIYGVN